MILFKEKGKESTGLAGESCLGGADRETGRSILDRLLLRWPKKDKVNCLQKIGLQSCEHKA